MLKTPKGLKNALTRTKNKTKKIFLGFIFLIIFIFSIFHFLTKKTQSASIISLKKKEKVLPTSTPEPTPVVQVQYDYMNFEWQSFQHPHHHFQHHHHHHHTPTNYFGNKSSICPPIHIMDHPVQYTTIKNICVIQKGIFYNSTLIFSPNYLCEKPEIEKIETFPQEKIDKAVIFINPKNRTFSDYLLYRLPLIYSVPMEFTLHNKIIVYPEFPEEVKEFIQLTGISNSQFQSLPNEGMCFDELTIIKEPPCEIYSAELFRLMVNDLMNKNGLSIQSSRHVILIHDEEEDIKPIQQKLENKFKDITFLTYSTKTKFNDIRQIYHSKIIIYGSKAYEYSLFSQFGSTMISLVGDECNVPSTIFSSILGLETVEVSSLKSGFNSVDFNTLLSVLKDVLIKHNLYIPNDENIPPNQPDIF